MTRKTKEDILKVNLDDDRTKGSIMLCMNEWKDQELLSLQDENKRLREVLGNIITESYNSTAQLKEFEEYRDYWYEQAGLNTKEDEHTRIP